MSRRATRCGLFGMLFIALSAAGAAAEISWDILDQRYGDPAYDAGAVSFNASYEYLFGSMPPAETLENGYAALTLDMSSGNHYPCMQLIPGMVTDGGDVTIEFKVRMADNTPLNLYISDTNSTSSAHWNHIIQVNRIYNVTTPDSIADYNQRDTATNIAPYGFNGSLVQTYRVVRQDGKTHLYAYDASAPVHLGMMGSGAGAAADGQNLEWGFAQDPGKAVRVEFHHLKIGRGADPYRSMPVARHCGDPCTVYLPTDFNRDCRVDHLDLEALSESWLACTDLRNPDCVRYLPGVIDVANAKQLFIDELFFDSVDNVALKVNPALKTGELNLQREMPWESATLNWFNVMADEGKFKMWYECYDIDGWPTSDDTAFCYAESTDGINWTRPNIGLFSYQGSTDNNILFRRIGPPDGFSRVHGTGVFRDPAAPPSERYKAVGQGIWTDYAHHITGMYSADGLHWTRYPQPICFMHADSQYSGFWDNQLLKYVIFGRSFAGAGRAIGRSESGNFEYFPQLSLVLQHDPADPPNSDLYNSAALKYPYAPNAYFMFLSVFNKSANKIDIRLAASRDGVTWTRPDITVPFIPNGPEGAYDGGTIYMGQGIIRMGDELWQYYGGSRLGHDGHDLSELILPGNGRYYSRVVTRLDGYISADAGATTGHFVTPKMVYDGSRLKLNVKVQSGGSVRVALLDAVGTPLPGCSIADCAPITGDHIETTVTWNGGADVSVHEGRVVKLRVEMTNASLYAFQFGAP